MELPEGYLPHKEEAPCPLEANDYCDCVILTEEGLGHSGIMKAKMHDWEATGMGSVVGYRLAKQGESLSPDHLLKRF